MPHSPPAPVSAVYAAGPKTWTVAWDRPIINTDGPVDPDQWRIKSNAGFVNPDSVALLAGDTVFQSGLFTGAETGMRFMGPPPNYYNDRGTPIETMPAWWLW